MDVFVWEVADDWGKQKQQCVRQRAHHNHKHFLVDIPACIVKFHFVPVEIKADDWRTNNLEY
jgi:hypothetical protein